MKHKMSDLAMPPMETGMPIGKEAYRKYYPTINLSDMQMPDLEDLDTKQPIVLTFEGFVVGKNIEKHGDMEHTDFRIELRRGEIREKG